MKGIKDKDWLGILANWKIFSTNGDAIKEIFESPVKQFIGLVLIADWALLRIETLIGGGWPAIQGRIYLIIFGAGGFIFYLLMKYRLGASRVTKRYQNKIAQFTRIHNDNQLAKLIKDVEEIKRDLDK